MKGLKEYITESSLSRIWRKIQEHDSGALTGYRDENSKQQNRNNNREIVAFLRSKNYSVTGIQGNYIENFKTDDAKEVGEPSFFVVDHHDTGNLHKDLIALGMKYDQDSVLIVPRGGKGAYLYGTSRRDNAFPSFKEKSLTGDGKFGRVTGKFLSRIKGREFAFEAYKEPPTRNGKWAAHILGEQIDAELRVIIEKELL
jgi:hypothetical protein